MRVKDWQKFQHYKERNPPWIKLHKSLLDDPDWHDLDPVNAKALVMIWLIASESDGELPDERKLAFRLRMKPKECAATLAQLSHWLVHDASSALATCTTETETETYRKEAETERAGAREPRRGNKARLPEGFEPSKDAVLAAGLTASEGEREFQKFKNHAAQNERTCVNWQAAWANWCIKAAEFLGKPITSDAPIDWDQVLGFYKKTQVWSRHVGPEPGMSGCKAPPEMLEKYGIAA